MHPDTRVPIRSVQEAYYVPLRHSVDLHLRDRIDRGVDDLPDLGQSWAAACKAAAAIGHSSSKVCLVLPQDDRQ
jgi:hypothetical protein